MSRGEIVEFKFFFFFIKSVESFVENQMKHSHRNSEHTNRTYVGIFLLINRIKLVL